MRRTMTGAAQGAEAEENARTLRLNHVPEEAERKAKRTSDVTNDLDDEDERREEEDRSTHA